MYLKKKEESRNASAVEVLRDFGLFIILVLILVVILYFPISLEQIERLQPSRAHCGTMQSSEVICKSRTRSPSDFAW